jgi:hypothetical protein
MNCAICSLPVPLSPEMKTDASVAATFRASARTRWNAADPPSSATFSLWPCFSSSVRSSAFDSRATSTACAARPIRICRWLAANGFGR